MSIGNSSKIEQYEKNAHYLEVINSFASQLLMSQTVDEIVWTVAKQAVGKLGYVDCIVYLFDEDRGCLVQRAAHGPKNPVALDIKNPITLQLGEGICGTVAKSGQPELIGDTSQDDRYLVDDDVRFSEITVPILSSGKVIGVIDSEHPEKNFYTEEDLKILTTIASMTSSKLDQAMAREKLEAHSDQLEILVNQKTTELKEYIQELEEANESIKQSNKEKEILLKEIHHRVKNNLQVISSLLNLHASKVSNHEDESVFIDCRNRIMSMAAIHEQLYQNQDMAKIETQKYFVEICDKLLSSFNKNDQLKIEYDIEPIALDLDRSVPLGLILNELVVNSIKHAFNDNIEGLISVKLHQSNGVINFSVADNGRGLDLQSAEQSLGFELIDTLTNQIDGELTFSSDNTGTSCSISFPTSTK